MREIKFRAWDSIGKRMLEDVEYHKVKDFKVNQEKKQWFIMQFTGLKDKDEKEIYEGDIVTFEIANFSYVGEIKFEAGAFIIGCNELDDSYQSLIEFDIEDNSMWQVRVIGNIYENPELLKEDKSESEVKE